MSSSHPPSNIDTDESAERLLPVNINEEPLRTRHASGKDASSWFRHLSALLFLGSLVVLSISLWVVLAVANDNLDNSLLRSTSHYCRCTNFPAEVEFY